MLYCPYLKNVIKKAENIWNVPLLKTIESKKNKKYTMGHNLQAKCTFLFCSYSAHKF